MKRSSMIDCKWCALNALLDAVVCTFDGFRGLDDDAILSCRSSKEDIGLPCASER